MSYLVAELEEKGKKTFNLLPKLLPAGAGMYRPVQVTQSRQQSQLPI